MNKDTILKEGLRFNSGKRRWGLLSWPALGELVKVLEFGAKKYDSWNWSNGLSWTETYESLMRHLNAWYTGEDKDAETGLSHMAHVLCNAMFLLHFIMFKTGRDDRPAALRGENIERAEPERTTDNPAVRRAERLEPSTATRISDPVGPERGVHYVQEDLFSAPRSCGC